MFLLRLFGTKKEEPIIVDSTKTNNIISNLKLQLTTLEKRNAYLEIKIQKLVAEIRIIASTNKKRALMMLNTKKQYDSEIQKNDGIRYTIESQINSLENSVINIEVTKSIYTGNEYIKNAQSKINIDALEDLMDDVVEQTETSQSISNIFTRKIDALCDDDELLAELNELQQMPQQTMPSLPNVPLHYPKLKNNVEEEAEEAELQKIRLEMIS